MPGVEMKKSISSRWKGLAFQVWHFNLFNPQTSALITLSYSWAHDDPLR